MRPGPARGPDSQSRRALAARGALAAFAVFSALGLLRFSYLFLDDVVRDRSGTFLERLIEESTGAYAALLLFGGVVWLFRRFPLDRPGWRRRVPVHVLGVVIYSS